VGAVFPHRSAARLLAALCLLALAAPASGAVPAAERSALVALYNGTGGASWTSHTGWLGLAGTECSWLGVQCDSTGAMVTGLALPENNLKGSLPASLGNLSHLQSLDLGGNAISGALPTALGRLASLRILHLDLNQISGALPRELGGLGNLTVLDLPFNKITGSLPVELGNLSNLQVLDLGGNLLSGTLPAQLGSLRSLTFLDLSGNQLGGAIPAGLAGLANLQTLYLDDNQLSGAIPPALGSLAALEQLGLSGNQLSGTIPRELGNLQQLMFLNLGKNQLGGPVPPELGNALSLIGVLLSSNNLAGTIPGTFLNPPNLETLWLDHNRFIGPVPFELGAIPTLDDNGGLDLRSNALATDTEPGLLADLDTKQAGGSWQGSQAATAPFDPQFPLSGLADRRTGGFMIWTLQTVAGSPPLSLSTSGGTGDADLYVRFGSPPTQTQFDASSANPGDQESVTIAAPRAGTYYIGLRTRAPYTGVTLRNGAGPAVCFPGDASLCLNGGRFKVEVAWRTADGQSGPGHAVGLTGDTGYFWFFDASNVEVVLKVLDACGLNQKFWIFAGGLTNVQVNLTVTDTRTGTVKTYRNAQGSPFQPIQDTGAFSTCNASAVADAAGAADVAAVAASASQEVERIVAAVANCAPSSTNLCLSGGRFKVEVAWKTPDGQTGAGQAVALTPDTGYFWFFSASNVEMVLKVLNACGFNNRFWVYAGGLTNVQVTVTVTDTANGTVRTYMNPQGTSFRPIQDSSAFATCP
jgi:Leucine-rich repeat (LRR) protein